MTQDFTDAIIPWWVGVEEGADSLICDLWRVLFFSQFLSHWIKMNKWLVGRAWQRSPCPCSRGEPAGWSRCGPREGKSPCPDNPIFKILLFIYYYYYYLFIIAYYYYKLYYLYYFLLLFIIIITFNCFKLS